MGAEEAWEIEELPPCDVRAMGGTEGTNEDAD